MATYNKFQDFVEQLCKAKHDFSSHTYKLGLTNTAPSASDTSFLPGSSHPPPASANGYPSGGTATTITTNESSGTMTVSGAQVVFTASGGALGPFRYPILYNDTMTSPADGPVSWWDYGSSITLADGETFTTKFNNASPGTIFTLA